MQKTHKRKVGSGRTKGAVSFCTVTLGKLNKSLKPNTRIVLSRRWAQMLLIKGTPIVASTKALEKLAA